MRKHVWADLSIKFRICSSWADMVDAISHFQGRGRSIRGSRDVFLPRMPRTYRYERKTLTLKWKRVYIIWIIFGDLLISWLLTLYSASLRDSKKWNETTWSALFVRLLSLAVCTAPRWLLLVAVGFPRGNIIYQFRCHIRMSRAYNNLICVPHSIAFASVYICKRRISTCWSHG